MKFSWLICLGVIGVMTMTSCGPKEKDKPDDTREKNAEKEIVWNWKEFERNSELHLQTLPIDIQPKRSLDIKSEASGIITLEVNAKVTPIQKDVIFARMDIDALAEQGERLSIQEEKRILEQMKAEKLELPEKRKKAKEELKEARRKVRLMELIMKNPAMKEMASELFGGDIGVVNKAALTDAKESLKLAEQKMVWADEFDEKLRKGELRIQEMDAIKNKRNFQEAKDHSVYKAPFTGELRIELEFVEGQKEYTVTGRESIATLNDFSEIHGLLKISNASWINLSPKRLTLQLNDQAKTLMPFIKDRIDKDKRTQREVRKYIFSVPLENNEALKRLVGTRMKGELIYKLPKTCFIVPKYNLSLYALGKTDAVDWGKMVSDLWPGAKVLAEGLSHVAIDYQP